MYKYTDNNIDTISLHDCRTTEVRLNDGVLSFVFEDGFWICKDNKNNPYNKLLGTDKSEMSLKLSDISPLNSITVHIFTEKGGKTYREQITLDDLTEMLNNGAELEFLYDFRNSAAIIFQCWLWFRKRPFYKECEIIVNVKNISTFTI